MNVCIYGSASDAIPSVYLERAESLGKELGKRNHTIIFGGGTRGIMGAVARGTTSQKGSIIGIAPTFFDKPGILFPHCTDFIYTETMRERKQKMEDLSDAFIAFPGGFGTFDEFFEILTLKQLGKHTKPVILYNIDGYYDGILSQIETSVSEDFVSAQKLSILKVFTEEGPLLEYLEKELK